MQPSGIPVSGEIKSLADVLVQDGELTRVKSGYEIIAHVPARYAKYGLLQETEVVSSICIMGLIVRNTKTDYQQRFALHLLATITMNPSERGDIEIRNGTGAKAISYREYTLLGGDIMMNRSYITQNKDTIRAAYVEFMSRGDIPYWFKYKDLATFLDSAKRYAGDAPKSDHFVMETLVAQLARTKRDLQKPFRHALYEGATDADLRFVGARDISAAADSTQAQIMGSYMGPAINAALSTTRTQNHVSEDLLRGTVDIKDVD